MAVVSHKLRRTFPGHWGSVLSHSPASGTAFTMEQAKEDEEGEIPHPCITYSNKVALSCSGLEKAGRAL